MQQGTAEARTTAAVTPESHLRKYPKVVSALGYAEEEIMI
jgi:hypothetical protein